MTRRAFFLFACFLLIGCSRYIPPLEATGPVWHIWTRPAGSEHQNEWVRGETYPSADACLLDADRLNNARTANKIYVCSDYEGP